MPSSSKKQNVVTFSEVHDPLYGMLSPLSPSPLVVRHVQYPSLHHYFLCERFKGSPAEQWMAEATTVWSLERLVKTAEEEGYQRHNWNKVKVDVMLLGTYFKFKQNEAARAVLLSTQPSLLLYHTPTDDFWGDGGDGKGKNVLGVVSMAVRARLHSEEERQKQRPPASGRHSKSAAAKSPALPATRT
ncbi:conserved hypothetical protein [Leishmania major strain Friedlin]|uniref:NADAR domain-containing protein n=1 Tax=Leishmania major TaxID=5664 RepID=Q4QJ66_LEIMA|nr:conserved hypothetical protein [Leishmania major strain Friedlin]CAG9568805.1 Domain_of_unknown_function_(DUF1768)_-_putative [Leishmania major strain Friedlin]CAJ02056.1 conserved hypothetical protein [Leishmania major strain Friedlin]|eukprot:XP_001680782.1 conserved hypothetical protein [Leishmania major strain Friedlin]